MELDEAIKELKEHGYKLIKEDVFDEIEEENNLGDSDDLYAFNMEMEEKANGRYFNCYVDEDDFEAEKYGKNAIAYTTTIYVETGKVGMRSMRHEHVQGTIIVGEGQKIKKIIVPEWSFEGTLRQFVAEARG